VGERGARQALHAGSDGAFSAAALAGESLATPLEGGSGRRIVFGSRAPAFELELAEDGKRYRIAGRIDGRVERLAGAEPAR
jgi:general secretion pathway protein H